MAQRGLFAPEARLAFSGLLLSLELSAGVRSWQHPQLDSEWTPTLWACEQPPSPPLACSTCLCASPGWPRHHQAFCPLGRASLVCTRRATRTPTGVGLTRGARLLVCPRRCSHRLHPQPSGPRTSYLHLSRTWKQAGRWPLLTIRSIVLLWVTTLSTQGLHHVHPQAWPSRERPSGSLGLSEWPGVKQDAVAHFWLTLMLTQPTQGSTVPVHPPISWPQGPWSQVTPGVSRKRWQWGI